MVNILDMHRRHGEFAWHVHDERFRRVRALGPSMPWHLTNWDLAMDAVQTVVVRQSDTQQPPFRFAQHPNQQHPNQQHPNQQHPNQQPARGPSGFCFEYNDTGNTGKCGRVDCRFAHLCENCGRKGYRRAWLAVAKMRKPVEQPYP